MAGVIVRASFPKLMVPGLHAVFGDVYNKHPMQWEGCFEKNNSYRAYEEEVAVNNFGLLKVKGETDGLIYDSSQQMYVSRYTNISYGLAFAVAREEIEDNLYGSVATKRTKALARSAYETQENVAASVFNLAFSASAPIGDGKSLINSAHPTTGGTLSNTLDVAADLSEAAAEELLINISQARDNRNKHIYLKPEMLLIPSQQMFTATRIFKNPERPGTADRDISALYAMNSLPVIKTNVYLTDVDAWFILTDCPDGLKYFERSPIRFEEDNDFNTKNGLYSVYHRYSFGASDWRAIWGSPGVGA
jgi:hypothetical protein